MSRAGVGCDSVWSTSKPRLGNSVSSSFGEARAEQPVLVDEHDGARGAAGGLVDSVEVLERLLRHLAEARAEAERVGEPARDDLVGRRRRRRGRAGRSARPPARRRGRSARRSRRRWRRRPRPASSRPRRCRPRGGRAGVAEDRLDRLAVDAAGFVDHLDRELGADAALLAVEGEGAGHRLEDADLDRRGLRAQVGGCADQRGGRRRALEERAAGEREAGVCHGWRSPRCGARASVPVSFSLEYASLVVATGLQRRAPSRPMRISSIWNA